MILVTLSLFIIVAYNVTRRYIFNNSIAWADELARFLFIWVNLLGMISVFQNNELVGLDILSNVSAL
ncbi:TRAP transporter small permease [uncultured Sphaerochaeta sp.]|uniref:TRAP transporter small permease n=1 Tax=uncultured Sphaerochaeta sp. TaxID=886478 RepID=UPI0037494CF2